MSMLVVFIIAIVILLVFRMLHWLLRPLARRQMFWQRINYLLIGIELLAWTAWLFWVIRQVVLSRNVYIFSTVTVGFMLTGIVTWFLLRDIIAGVIFKLQHNLKLQQSIQMAGHSGRLQRLGLTSLTLESSAGEQVKIPYTKLINETVVHNEASEVVDLFDFVLKVPKSFSKERWIRMLCEQVMLLPWASVRRRPIVQWQREEGECHVFELRVHSLSAQHAQLIETHLQRVYNKSEE